MSSSEPPILPPRAMPDLERRGESPVKRSRKMVTLERQVGVEEVEEDGGVREMGNAGEEDIALVGGRNRF